jgi:hypothetical protein
MSIMEVYCEQLNDLLDPSKVNLEVAEVPVKGGTPGLTSLVIKGLTEVKVSSLQAALDLFKKGQDARKVRGHVRRLYSAGWAARTCSGGSWYVGHIAARFCCGCFRKNLL